MSKPIGYYASAPCGTKDNAILCEIESNYGSWLEKVAPSQKSAWLIVLITEVAEPEGASVDFCIDKPILSSLFNLSDGCKVDLAVAVLIDLARIPARKIAKLLNISQKVNGRDQPKSFLRAQIKGKLQQPRELPPAAIQAVRELLAS